MNQPLIKLEGVQKVFYTDEVETHALDNINIEIDRGEYVSIAGPSGCGKSTLLSILGPARHAHRRHLRAERPARRPSCRWPQRARVRNREVGLHLPELQPDWRPHRLRERRAAAHLSRHARGRAQAARDGGARARRHGAPRQAPPEPALGRSAAARRRGARGLRRAVDPARRRADRQPRLEERRGGDGPAQGAALEPAPPSAW